MYRIIFTFNENRIQFSPLCFTLLFVSFSNMVSEHLLWIHFLFFLQPCAMASSSDMDPSNPFFLHHGDSPGSVLVSQPLIGDNYHTWSQSMVMALTAKNKVAFVDCTLLKPTNSSDSLNQVWCRCNNMVWPQNTICTKNNNNNNQHMRKSNIQKNHKVAHNPETKKKRTEHKIKQ